MGRASLGLSESDLIQMCNADIQRFKLATESSDQCFTESYTAMDLAAGVGLMPL